MNSGHQMTKRGPWPLHSFSAVNREWRNMWVALVLLDDVMLWERMPSILPPCQQVAVIITSRVFFSLEVSLSIQVQFLICSPLWKFVKAGIAFVYCIRLVRAALLHKHYASLCSLAWVTYEYRSNHPSAGIRWLDEFLHWRWRLRVPQNIC